MLTRPKAKMERVSSDAVYTGHKEKARGKQDLSKTAKSGQSKNTDREARPQAEMVKW